MPLFFISVTETGNFKHSRGVSDRATPQYPKTPTLSVLTLLPSMYLPLPVPLPPVQKQ